jgi:hypothetical protein
MTACTEQHMAALGDGLAGEGRKGMSKEFSVTACAGRHAIGPGHGMAKEAQP